MSFRLIYPSSLNRSLSNLMVAPSSSNATMHKAGLSEYHRLGGNCIHLHGEGGETHSRQTTGVWLRQQGLRPAFFLCAQICHEQWDDNAQQPILRFTPEGVREDVATDLELLGTEYLDLVYLDDQPTLPLEPVLEAIFSEIEHGRVRAFGVRNWAAERIRTAHAYASARSAPGIAALITTELSLLCATRPLWPEYLPFDASIERVVQELGLAVFAHAGDYTLGQCLFGDEDPVARMRLEWIERWDHPENLALVERIQEFATVRGLTPREVSLAWLLNQSFPVIAIVELPSLLTDRHFQYERASQMLLTEAERTFCDGFSRPFSPEVKRR